MQGRISLPSLAILVLPVALASCRSVSNVIPETPPPTSGQVNGSEVTPESATRMTLRPDQAFVRGELIEPSAAPAYPSEALTRALPPQVVCVQFVVGKDGTVSNIVPAVRAPDCPTGGVEQAPFVAATVAAVSQWEFYSNQLCLFPAGTSAERRCSGPGVRVEPVAVTLTYRFEFSQRDGAGVVERSAP